MRAQLLYAPAPVEESPLRYSEIPDPQPEPGRILIRVAACGVCHTDLHTVEGELRAPRFPIIPGHQVVGRVAALGSIAGDWSIGERAGVFWLHRSCGVCEFCKRGEENLCPAAEFTGNRCRRDSVRACVGPISRVCRRLPRGPCTRR